MGTDDAKATWAGVDPVLQGALGVASVFERALSVGAGSTAMLTAAANESAPSVSSHRPVADPAAPEASGDGTRAVCGRRGVEIRTTHGGRVRLQGLVNDVGLNGQLATVQSLLDGDDNGRALVRLEASGETLNIGLDKLRPLSEVGGGRVITPRPRAPLMHKGPSRKAMPQRIHPGNAGSAADIRQAGSAPAITTKSVPDEEQTATPAQPAPLTSTDTPPSIDDTAGWMRLVKAGEVHPLGLTSLAGTEERTGSVWNRCHVQSWDKATGEWIVQWSSTREVARLERFDLCFAPLESVDEVLQRRQQHTCGERQQLHSSLRELMTSLAAEKAQLSLEAQTTLKKVMQRRIAAELEASSALLHSGCDSGGGGGERGARWKGEATAKAWPHNVDSGAGAGV